MYEKRNITALFPPQLTLVETFNEAKSEAIVFGPTPMATTNTWLRLFP